MHLFNQCHLSGIWIQDYYQTIMLFFSCNMRFQDVSHCLNEQSKYLCGVYIFGNLVILGGEQLYFALPKKSCQNYHKLKVFQKLLSV